MRRLPAAAGGVAPPSRAARATVLAGRKSAAAALRYPKSPMTTYFVLHGADIQIPNDRRVPIAASTPSMREITDYNIIL